jgi:hypothetical protein
MNHPKLFVIAKVRMFWNKMIPVFLITDVCVIASHRKSTYKLIDKQCILHAQVHPLLPNLRDQKAN